MKVDRTSMEKEQVKGALPFFQKKGKKKLEKKMNFAEAFKKSKK